jgi:iron complex outermembrane recepter protein
MSGLGFNASIETEWGKSIVDAPDVDRRGTRFFIRFGKKLRFPTMRELFGDALNTFLLNPDLQPESTWLLDVSVGRSTPVIAGNLTVFARRTIDTIDRVNVSVDGETKRLRVNLDGSRVYGIELTGTSKLSSNISFDAHLMWARSTALLETGDRPLNEKPDVLSSASVLYTAAWGGTLRLTGQYTGRAYSLSPDNSQITLPTALVVNIRGAVRHTLNSSLVFLEAYAGVNNVADTVVLPQAGLPAAGREWRLGLNVTFF